MSPENTRPKRDKSSSAAEAVKVEENRLGTQFYIANSYLNSRVALKMKVKVTTSSTTSTILPFHDEYLPLQELYGTFMR